MAGRPEGSGTPEVNGFSVAARVRSFGHALHGVAVMLASQHNAWIHGVATVAVCVLGAGLGVSLLGWCALILAMLAVWSAEALNTAFELLCDVAAPEFHPLVEKAKDVAAGAVLITAIGAAAVGLLVLGPPLARALRG